MNRDLLNMIIVLSNFGSDGKQHTRLINQFEAKEIVDYIYKQDEKIEQLQNRIDKAVEYMKFEWEKIVEDECYENHLWSVDGLVIKKILNILQDKEEA